MLIGICSGVRDDDPRRGPARSRKVKSDQVHDAGIFFLVLQRPLAMVPALISGVDGLGVWEFVLSSLIVCGGVLWPITFHLGPELKFLGSGHGPRDGLVNYARAEARCSCACRFVPTFTLPGSKPQMGDRCEACDCNLTV